MSSEEESIFLIKRKKSGTLHDSTMRSEEEYVDEVRGLANSDALAQNFSNPPTADPKFCYINNSSGEISLDSAESLLKQAKTDLDTRTYAVCVIENISPSYISVLGRGLKLNPSFFAEHAENMGKDEFWKQTRRWSWDEGKGFEAEDRDERTVEDISRSPIAHIDGIFEYHDVKLGTPELELTSYPNIFPRNCFKPEKNDPLQSNTRISYCRVNPYLYLFLVDAPLALMGCLKNERSRARTSLRLYYSLHHRGLLLPQLFSQPSYRLFESLKSMFKNTWHLKTLLEEIPGVIPPHPMVYMLSSSLWGTNYKFLDSEIKRISFRDLRDPKDSTNDELHNLREDLEYLQKVVTETKNWVPETISIFFDVHPAYKYKFLTRYPQPVKNLTRYLADAEKLQGFLMDSFQLLISSLSVRESRLSIEQAKLSHMQATLSAEQARRSAWLAKLASLYLPLSVLTGIFGMNLKEINDAHVPFWWAFVALVVLGVCTLAVYYGLRGVEERKLGKKLGEKV